MTEEDGNLSYQELMERRVGHSGDQVGLRPDDMLTEAGQRLVEPCQLQGCPGHVDLSHAYEDRPMFGKRHYEAIAKALKKLDPSSPLFTPVDIIIALTDMLAEDNPRFDKKVFVKACTA